MLMENQRNILIVDDEIPVVLSVQNELEHNGYAVKTASNGEAAIILVRAEFFDIALVMMTMSGMNGVETCKQIKEISSKTQVVLLSTNPNQAGKLLNSFVDAGGIDVFLRKPFFINEVKDAVYKILN
jgi:CheY-like chemotaxis protein